MPTDGKRGMVEVQHDAWQGYEGNNLDAIIDLGQPTEISQISTRFLQAVGSWVFLPVNVEYLVSNDGESWTSLVNIPYNEPQKTENPNISDCEFKLDEPQVVRYLRVKAENMGTCPDWHPGAGGKAWIFVDEVVVR